MTGQNVTALPSLASLIEGGPVALFLDFDGTLVELAGSPDAITVPDGMGAALVALSKRLQGRLAVVSGRSIADLENYLGDLPIAMAGSHGAAIRAANGSPLGNPAKGVGDAARDALRQFAHDEGLGIEEKTHGAALHFRNSPDREADAHAFVDALAGQHDLATKRGKCVIELVERDIDKGRAVDVLLDQTPFQGAIPYFIGDDVTDEDGFAACQRHGGKGILVGERHHTKAAHTLAEVDAVHKWLELTF